MTDDTDLLTYLLLGEPSSVLLVEDHESPLRQGQGLKDAGIDLQISRLADLPPLLCKTPRFDLVIMHGFPQSLNKSALLAWLARIRDLHAKKFVVVYDHELSRKKNNFRPSLERADFFSLGFRLPPGKENQPAGIAVYEYAIQNYKSVPDWLNARFWANPHNWDKFRW